MWNFFRTCVISFYCVVSVVAAQEHWMDTAVNQIAKLKLYKVVVFTDSSIVKSANYFLVNRLIAKVTQIFPVLVIDPENVENIDHNRVVYSKILEYTRSSTLFVSLQNDKVDELYFEGVNKTLHFPVKILPNMTRPKMLLVSLTNRSEAKFKEILLQGWTLKYLDLTVLTINNNNNKSILINYNPFTNSFIRVHLSNDCTIFPDKMHNMNNYVLNISAFNLTPYSTLRYNKTSDSKPTVDGLYYPFLKIYSQKLNFSTHLVIIPEFSNVSKLFEKIIRKLEQSKVNIVPVALYIGSYTYQRNVTFGQTLDDERFVMIVPILPTSNIHVFLHILSNVCFFPILVLFLSIVVRFLKFHLDNWQAIQLLQVLLGSPVVKEPRKLAERFLFATVILLAMNYSTDVFAKLTDTRIVDGEWPLETVSDVLAADLPVYARYSGTDRSDKLLRRLRARNVKNISLCVMELARNRDRVCIAPSVVATYMIDTYDKRSPVTGNVQGGVSRMKMASQGFHDEKVAFGYESASPYAGRIDRLTQAILEAGLPAAWRSTYKRRGSRRRREQEDAHMTDGSVLLELRAVLFYGHLMAGVALMLELVYAGVKRKMWVGSMRRVGVKWLGY